MTRGREPMEIRKPLFFRQAGKALKTERKSSTSGRSARDKLDTVVDGMMQALKMGKSLFSRQDGEALKAGRKSSKMGPSAQDQMVPLISSMGYQTALNANSSGLHFVATSLVRRGLLRLVEVGSGNGELARACLKAGAERILGFEPNSQFASALEAIAQESHGKFSWREHAVGEKDGFTNLRYNPASPTEGTTSTSEQIPGFSATNALSKRVDRMTIDQAVDEVGWGPSMVVIDAPGSAEKILRGMARTLSSHETKAVLVSISPVPSRGETFVSSISTQLPQFDAFRILPGKVGMVKIAVDDPFANLPFPSFVLFSRRGSSQDALAALDISEDQEDLE